VNWPLSRVRVVGVLLVAAWATDCSRGSPTSPTPSGALQPPPGTRTAVLIGAGDIGVCGSPGTVATGRLIEATLGDVFLAGDLAYPHGSAVDFRNCFEPHWGHARNRWRPVPGNHEYESARASPYYQYFAETAGAGPDEYYRFVAGEWLVLMLNSNIDVSPTSAQYQFVRDSLQGRRFRCQMAMWHHPLFTSGQNGPNPAMRDMFQLLYDHNFDVVVNAHDHLYERFSRQDANGREDPNGIRQFIVGTGGAPLYAFVRTAPNSATRIASFGIIRFTLRPESYDWEFLETSGALGDNGSTPCH
jgi:acid phosphatase type 7